MIVLKHSIHNPNCELPEAVSLLLSLSAIQESSAVEPKIPPVRLSLALCWLYLDYPFIC